MKINEMKIMKKSKLAWTLSNSNLQLFLQSFKCINYFSGRYLCRNNNMGRQQRFYLLEVLQRKVNFST